MDLRKGERNLFSFAGNTSKIGDVFGMGGIAETQVANLVSKEEEVIDKIDRLAEGAAKNSDGDLEGIACNFDDGADIFLCTQVQSGMDEVEKSENSKSGFKTLLANFRYDDHEEPDLCRFGGSNSAHMVSKQCRKRRIEQNTSPSTRIRSITEHNTKNLEVQRQHDRAHNLLKMLSGKSVKLNSILKQFKKDVEVGDKFLIFNAQEWSEIVKQLQAGLPSISRFDIDAVRSYVYGEEMADNPWYASQIPPAEYMTDTPRKKEYNEEGETVVESRSTITLSQLLEHGSSGSSMGSESMDRDLVDAEECIILDTCELVSDSVDSGERIDLNSNISTICEDEVIDLTQETFKAVPDITSPLKSVSVHQEACTNQSNRELTTAVQDSESRVSTFPELHLSELPVNNILSNTQIVHMRIYQNQNLPQVCKTVHEDMVADSEDNDYTIIELDMNNLCASKPSTQQTKYSVQQLRHSLKIMGMKLSRTKSHMLESYNNALQELQSQTDEERYSELFARLTNLIRSDCSFLNRIYCFEPITLKDLRTFFENKDDFIKLIDDTLISQWADNNGICIKNDIIT